MKTKHTWKLNNIASITQIERAAEVYADIIASNEKSLNLYEGKMFCMCVPVTFVSFGSWSFRFILAFSCFC